MRKVRFFLKKRMKELFAYVLEVMLTLAKMQNNSTLINLFIYTIFQEGDIFS